MQNWPNEFVAEDRRQRILQEAEQIRLEKLVRKSSDRLRFFEQALLKVANWMISTGKQLRARHEISKEERWIHPHTKVTS
jgi:hypothetical protein